jgi:signal transduction histidine kinase
MHTLRSRLVLLTALIAVGATVSLALFSSRLSVRIVRRARIDDELAVMGPLRTLLVEQYADSGWDGVRRRVSTVARVSGRQLLLTDSVGQFAAAAPAQMRAGDFTIGESGGLTRWQVDLPAASLDGARPAGRVRAQLAGSGLPGLDLTDPAGHHLGTLYSIPAGGGAATAFSPTATQWPLAIAAAAIAAAAILTTLLLSRRLLGPVEQLTAAATAMTAGDLARRVIVRGSDEIATLSASFNAMADALGRAQHLRQTMTGDIAHEFRTPLTNIRCTVESLADGMIDASPDVFASMQEEIQLLQRMIDDLQDLALADLGELRLHRATIDPAHAAAASVRAMEREATARGVDLVARTSAVVAILADGDRVQQVLRNLIRNAIVHTPRGGVVVVSVAAAGPDAVAFTVQDTGSGIAAEHLPELFQRFYRVDSSRSRDTGGAGLGLAIVQSLALAHGGRVAVSSVPGKGSEFRVILPIAGVLTRPS